MQVECPSGRTWECEDRRQRRPLKLRRSLSHDNVQRPLHSTILDDEDSSLRAQLKVAHARIAELQHGQQAIFKVLDAVASQLDAHTSESSWNKQVIEPADQALPHECMPGKDSQVINLVGSALLC